MPGAHDSRVAGPAPPRTDLQLLDGLRLLANFEVVLHHMGGRTLFGSTFGVPLFMTLMTALAVSSTRAETALAFGRRKARALLTPWLRWSVVYVALAVTMDLIADRPANASLSWGMLVIGGHPSLWFLPAALALLLAVKPIQAGAARLSPGRAAALFGALAATYTLAVPELVELAHRDLPDQTWIRVSPALLWGAAIAQSTRARSGAERVAILCWIAALALAVWAARPETARLEDPIPRFGVAAPLTCLGFGLNIQVHRWIRFAATATFGIYVSHVLVAKGLTRVADPSAWPDLVHAAVVWSLSFALVLALRGSGLRWRELRTQRRPAARKRPAAA